MKSKPRIKVKVITIGVGMPATVTGNSSNVVLRLPPLEDIVRQDLISETKLAAAAGWPFSRMEYEINKVVLMHG